jgi:hypothetical protein
MNEMGGRKESHTTDNTSKQQEDPTMKESKEQLGGGESSSQAKDGMKGSRARLARMLG